MSNPSSDAISGLIETLRGVPDLAKSCQDAVALPDCFRVAIGIAVRECDRVACTLEVVRSQAGEQIGSGSNIDTEIDLCQNKSKRLRRLLSFCFEDGPDGAYSRYIDQIQRLGEERVETLVLGIVRGVESALGQYQDTEGQRSKLGEAITELLALTPSVADDKLRKPSYQLAHHGSGAQNTHLGTGHQGINSGSGAFYLGTSQTFNHGIGEN